VVGLVILVRERNGTVGYRLVIEQHVLEISQFIALTIGFGSLQCGYVNAVVNEVRVFRAQSFVNDILQKGFPLAVRLMALRQHVYLRNKGVELIAVKLPRLRIPESLLDL